MKLSRQHSVKKEETAEEKYGDIIGLDRPVSRHPKMSGIDRAAQFSPFAALTGYGAAVEETARLTKVKRELSEEEKEILDRRLAYLRGKEKPRVCATYFVPDLRKEGGSYETHTGTLLRIDEVKRTLLFEDGTLISLDEVLSLEDAQEKGGEEEGEEE